MVIQNLNIKILYREIFNYKSSEFMMTHQPIANRWSLSSHMVSVVARILFSGYQRLRCGALLFLWWTDGRTDGQTYVRADLHTDTMRENNDHLFGRGLVGQKLVFKSSRDHFHAIYY